MTGEKNPRTELMDRITAEWMRACGERDWYQAELTKANQKIGDMLVHADELEKIVRISEKRAAERDQMAVELGIAQTERSVAHAEAKELRHWLWRIHDAGAGHIAPDHKTNEQLGECTLQVLTALSSLARHAIADDNEALLMRRVDEFDWSVRTANCLQSIDVVVLGDLVQKNETQLLRAKHFGRRSLTEVKELLAKLGLQLGIAIPDWKDRIERWNQRQVPEEP